MKLTYKPPQKSSSLTSKNQYKINPGQMTYLIEIHYKCSLDVEKTRKIRITTDIKQTKNPDQCKQMRKKRDM